MEYGKVPNSRILKSGKTFLKYGWKNKMLEYNQKVLKYISCKENEIPSFVIDEGKSVEKSTIRSFGEEWKKFSSFNAEEISLIGSEYFDIVSDQINKSSVVLDVGCGTGRWSKYIADKVNFVEAIDPSDAVFPAMELNHGTPNIRITQASTDNIPFQDESFDFIFCLGVLHHIPDTKKALQNIIRVLKQNAHILVYLYYNFDNKNAMFKFIFKLSSLIRKVVSAMPFWLKSFTCDILSILIYIPFILTGRLCKFIFKGNFYKNIPLSYYINKSYKVIRNDTLDRFGTRIEKRFTKKEIVSLLSEFGIGNIVFSEKEPYWHFIGQKLK
jgi:ubiquinone/menaquinone biosynthesis C-methylase UbiE